jgi:hypothetical protein
METPLPRYTEWQQAVELTSLHTKHALNTLPDSKRIRHATKDFCRDIETRKYKEFIRDYIVNQMSSIPAIRAHLRNMIWFEARGLSFVSKKEVRECEIRATNDIADIELSQPSPVTITRPSTEVEEIIWNIPDETIICDDRQSTVLRFPEEIGLLTCMDRGRTYQVDLRFRLVLEQTGFESSSELRQSSGVTKVSIDVDEKTASDNSDDHITDDEIALSSGDDAPIIYHLATLTWRIDDILCHSCLSLGYDCRCFDTESKASVSFTAPSSIDFEVNLEFTKVQDPLQDSNVFTDVDGNRFARSVDTNRTWILHEITLSYKNLWRNRRLKKRRILTDRILKKEMTRDSIDPQT